MKRGSTPYTALRCLLTVILLLLSSVGSAQPADTLRITSDTLSLRYTVCLADHLQERGSTPVCVALYCQYGQKARGAHIFLSEEQVYCLKNETDTVWLLRNSLPNPCKTTTWTFVRSTTLKIYREGICLGTVPESTADTPEAWVSGDRERLQAFCATVVSSEEAVIPDERVLEERIEGMLDSSHDKFKNLAPDPYCNHGLITSDVTAYTTADAAIRADASVCTTSDADAYSIHGLRISGEPADGTQPLLSMPVSFTAGTPYLIRVMARSAGYTARLAIGKENNWTTLHDTEGEWKAIECVFTPSANRTALELSFEDATADATLDLDNWEIYACLTSTSKVLGSTAITGVQLTPGQSWTPRQKVRTYWLGFADNGSGCSAIDTALVEVAGLTSLTMKVEGSRMYPLAFPGPLVGMHVDGSYDMASHTREQLLLGVDYLLQRYRSPWFEFVADNERTAEGCYMVQFVDNLDDTQVTMNFNRCSAIIDGVWTAGTERLEQDGYAFVGNPAFAPFTPEGKFLRYNAGRQLFVLTRGEELQPFEAYITTSLAAPVPVISTGYDTRLTRVKADDDCRIGIYASRGSLTLTASADTNVRIFTPAGAEVACVPLQQGVAGTLTLPSGLYIVGRSKILIP